MMNKNKEDITMVKIVNVVANYSVSGVKANGVPFVRGRLRGVKMTTEDIYKCLSARASVTEVVGDKRIRLTLTNYKQNFAAATVEETATVVNEVIPHTTQTIKAEPEVTIPETTGSIPEPELPEETAEEVQDAADTVEEVTEDVADETVEEPADEEATTEPEVAEQSTETTEESTTTVTQNNGNHRRHKRH